MMKPTDQTAIIKAIKASDIQSLKQLIVNAQFQLTKIYDDTHSTLLHLATNNNNYEIAELILKEYDRRVDENIPNYSMESKKQWVNQKDKDGFTAIHYSVFRGNFKLCNFLQANYADIYAINDQGLSVLHIAAQGDSPCLMYYYLNKGFKISMTDFKGSTPLHWACYSGQQNAVNALLAWEAEIDRQDTSYGMTPLHLAVMSGNGRIVKKLLLRGCDRNIKNFANKLPVEIAQQNEYVNIEAMILDRGLIKEILNIKTPFRKTEKYTYHFYFLVFVFFLNYCLNVSFVVFEHISSIFEMCIIFLSLGLICVGLFLIIRCADSGRLRPSNNQGKYFFQILIRNEPQTICYDCQIVKPQRSRHCQICQTCISVFDHHCPWVAKCVGSGNYFLFYIFLLFMWIFVTYSIPFQIINLLVNDWSTLSPLLFIRSFCICLSLLTCAIFFLPITFLLFIQTRNCLKDETTFQKYSNKNQSPKQESSSNLSSSPMLNSSENISRENNKSAISLSMVGQRSNSDKKFLQKPNYLKNCYRMCFGNKNNISYNVGGF